MDRYIFEQFMMKIETRHAKEFFDFLKANAQKRIDTKNKTYLINYPQEDEQIELILETEKDETGKLNIKDFLFHHKSKQEWEFKILKSMNQFSNTYIVNNKEDKNTSCIRLVNEEVIGKELKPNTTIKAQVCGIVMIANIFQTEEDYKKRVTADKNGNKTLMKDGYLIPYNLFVNNSASLSEEERQNRDHVRDNLLTFKSKLKNVKKVDINISPDENNHYYRATIDTTYGELDIIIPSNICENISDIKDNNIIIGELLLSGNLCTGKYKKQIKENKED